jgi:Zn-dependent peptidase ImmA (M78 family)
MFTYFHELAHLIFHTSGIDTIHDRYLVHLGKDQQRIEILCNSFAANFLLPDTEFEQASHGLEPSQHTAELLAQRFHVSREVVFRRFLERHRISEAQYKTAVKKWNEQRDREGGTGGDHYWTKLAYLGKEYVSLALSQFHQNRIDEYQLADYLDTKPKNVGTLEEYFHRGSV